MKGWVYILKLSNNKYYLGSTSNLESRIKTHESGKSNFTSKFLPVKLVLSQEFPSYQLAKSVELWLKKLKSKKIIEKIIEDGRITKEVNSSLVVPTYVGRHRRGMLMRHRHGYTYG